MATDIYDKGLDELLKGKDSGTGWTTDTIKILLLKTAGFTTTHDFVADVLAGAAEEADATNYARKTMASGSQSVAESGGTVTYDHTADITWTALGGATNNTIVAAVIYREITNDSDSPVLFYIDFPDTPTNGGDWTLQFHANGIYTIT